MPRHFAVALAAVSLFFVAAPLANLAFAQDAARPAGQHPRRPMPQPTNLRVLPRNIAVPDLLAMMRGYTAALGVECEFCHATDPTTHRPDYASDANSDKAIARTMITMTNDINAKYLSQVKDPDAAPAEKTVTCGTCHRGNSMPAPFGTDAKMGAHLNDDKAAPSEKKPE